MSALVAPSAIRADHRAQSRVGLDAETVADYAEKMAAGEVFPAVVAFQEGVVLWLGDGFHRHAAAVQAGLAEIAVEVRPGGLRDAILHSVGANAAHGLRRSNADKRRSVEKLLADDEWAAWSDVRIADQCGVSNRFVGQVRLSLNGSMTTGPRLVERGGKVFEQNTAAIGRRAETAPLAAQVMTEPAWLSPPPNVILLGDRLQVVPSERSFEVELAARRPAAPKVDRPSLL